MLRRTSTELSQKRGANFNTDHFAKAGLSSAGGGGCGLTVDTSELWAESSVGYSDNMLSWGGIIKYIV